MSLAKREYEALILDPRERDRIALLKDASRRAYEEAVAITAERRGAEEERARIVNFLREISSDADLAATSQYLIRVIADQIVNGDHLLPGGDHE